MSQQFSNHVRFSPTYHFITIPLIAALLVMSVINLVNSGPGNILQAVMFLLISLLLASVALHARIFALRAQDRAIRAQENLRHFVLTGRPLHQGLRLRQIIALRFAPDEELPELAQQAVAENMSNKAIKKAIRQWRADHHRV